MNPLHDFLMDRLRRGWRERREAQDPVWSFLERILVVALTGITSYLWIRTALALHFKFHPEDRLPFSDSNTQLPLPTFAGALLTVFLLLCVAGITVNSIEGLIPWARRRTETGSDRVAGLTITEANRGLAKAALALALITIPLDAYAILTSWSVP